MLIAALIPILFGSVMMFAPELMLYNTLTVEITTGSAQLPNGQDSEFLPWE